LLIDTYFESIQALVAGSPIVHSSNITYDKRSPHIGLIRGDIYFLDDSRLHIREFVNTQAGPERFMYVYHFQRAGAGLVFRYDNSPHFPGLSGFPHHKHVGDESTVIAATPLDLAAVLSEIEELLASR